MLINLMRSQISMDADQSLLENFKKYWYPYRRVTVLQIPSLEKCSSVGLLQENQNQQELNIGFWLMRRDIFGYLKFTMVQSFFWVYCLENKVHSSERDHLIQCYGINHSNQQGAAEDYLHKPRSLSFRKKRKRAKRQHLCWLNVIWSFEVQFPEGPYEIFMDNFRKSCESCTNINVAL